MASVLASLSLWALLLTIILWDIRDRTMNLMKKWAIMDILTGLVVILTAGLFITSYLQWKTLVKTDETYWIAQRPWLGPKNEISISNVYIFQEENRKGVSLEPSALLYNYGNLPITHARVRTQTLVGYFEDFEAKDRLTTFTRDEELWKSAEKALCDGSDTGPIKPKNAPAIFPKESSAINLEGFADLIEGRNNASSINMLVCVVYQFGYDNERSGHTFFVIDVEKSFPKSSFDLQKIGNNLDVYAKIVSTRTRAE